MVFPAAATGVADAAGLADAKGVADAVDVGVVVVLAVSLLPQAFSNRLVPKVAEPYKINLRRPNRFAMLLPYSSFNQQNDRGIYVYGAILEPASIGNLYLRIQKCNCKGVAVGSRAIAPRNLFNRIYQY